MSALEHILGDHLTVPPDAGLFLDQTWRMHPRLCRFTSETFYDGKLTYADGLGRQEILGDATLRGSGLRGSGLRVVEVEHEGNTNASPEEAEPIAKNGLAPCTRCKEKKRTSSSLSSGGTRTGLARGDGPRKLPTCSTSP